MKVMISQPMNGKTEEQIRSGRKSVIEKLEKMHIEVIDTVFDYDTKNINHVPVYYLAKSIEAMSNVDAVYFMKDWQMARGCRIEREVAHDYKIKILDTNFLEEEVTIKR